MAIKSLADKPKNEYKRINISFNLFLNNNISKIIYNKSDLMAL